MAAIRFEPENPPRVRFAPSPTGDLHIGSARTALFNYLFAKHYDGSFVLRIEDTDKVRSTEASLNNLVDGLNWLGIHWDEGPDESDPTNLDREKGDFGPYLQSARRQSHHDAAMRLLESGHAFECICPPQETVGTSKCNCQSRQNELKDYPQDQKSIKFHIPPGPPVVVKDIIRGEVVFRRDDLQDFIIMRADGTPTYNYVVVVDDASMEISHVIRGDDHLSNTPKQILIYEALELNVPEFAHIPLIHGPDGMRMSKRHGAVTIEAYQQEGFLPDAFVNYLATLGWNDGTDREIYSLDDIEKLFTLRDVSPSPAIFDRDKILWFNGKYIRELDDDGLYNVCMPYLETCVKPEALESRSKDWLTGMLGLFRERIDVLSDICDRTELFFNDPTHFSEKLLAKARVDGDAFTALVEIKKNLENTDWTTEAIETEIRNYIKRRELKMKAVLQPLRLVLTGTLATPGIFETLYYIGKEATLRRLENFLANYKPPRD